MDAKKLFFTVMASIAAVLIIAALGAKAGQYIVEPDQSASICGTWVRNSVSEGEAYREELYFSADGYYASIYTGSNGIPHKQVMQYVLDGRHIQFIKLNGEAGKWLNCQVTKDLLVLGRAVYERK